MLPEAARRRRSNRRSRILFYLLALRHAGQYITDALSRLVSGKPDIVIRIIRTAWQQTLCLPGTDLYVPDNFLRHIIPVSERIPATDRIAFSGLWENAADSHLVRRQKNIT